jgi:hypothetical protein
MSATPLINVFELFDGKNFHDFSFSEFKETFNQFFDTNDFAYTLQETIEEEHSTVLKDSSNGYLNQDDLCNYMATIILSIADYINNNHSVLTNIKPNDIKIRSFAINQEHFFKNEESTEIVVNFCVENVDIKEKESSIYKRLYHATRKHLEENFFVNKINSIDIQPFFEMSDDSFKKVVDSKLIDPVAIKQIQKKRKAAKKN